MSNPKNKTRVILLFIFLNAINYSFGLLGTPCKTPHQKGGICTRLRNCEPLYNIIKNPVVSEQKKAFVRKSLCGRNDGKITYCCPQIDLFPDSSICGQNTENKIVGGSEANLDEFPWLAMLEYTQNTQFDFKYNDKKHIEKEFMCGGALINSRYVITAAHCIKGIPRKWSLTGVRLGEHDTSLEIDCDTGGCSPFPLNVNVESIKIHEGYDPWNVNNPDDISLIRLAEDVEFTETVQPICLPMINSLISKDNHMGEELWVAGWGKTEKDKKSNVKLKVRMPVKEFSKCQKLYFEMFNRTLTDKQICVGGEKGRDSCKGDSGGPLMGIKFNAEKQDNYYLLGIVSFGPESCGLENVPGIYTNVEKYSDWIREHVVA